MELKMNEQELTLYLCNSTTCIATSDNFRELYL